MHTLHVNMLRMRVHDSVYCSKLTSSGGARTTAGWEAGAEYLGAAGNLKDAAECRKAAAEDLGPAGGLEAAAAYEMG